jgi:Pregnancy-associated plasma protein-A
MPSTKKTATKKTGTKKASADNTPQSRSCATLQVHYGLLDKYPELRANQAEIERFTRLALADRTVAMRTGVITIPVVVHVVHRLPAENISDAQIRSQIRVLNSDFRATNSDKSKVPAPFKPLAADAQIAFALAKRDPQGKSSTGITRTKTTRTSFTIDDEVKSRSSGGADAWDTTRYLNMWVCTLRGGLLGYAQFPGGPAATDGVVILNTAFGTSGSAAPPFNKGRTTTHEIGHYLNLSHIWGESRIPNCSDDDLVSDTPKQLGPNSGKPLFPHVTCNNGPNGDMFMNYMDYVDDVAMFMFSTSQVERMRAALTGPRSTLGT